MAAIALFPDLRPGENIEKGKFHFLIVKYRHKLDRLRQQQGEKIFQWCNVTPGTRIKQTQTSDTHMSISGTQRAQGFSISRPGQCA